MAARDNTYSRLIAWLRVLLPVLALVLLSTMFLIARTIDPNRALAFAKVDLDDLTGNQRVSGARFSGVTEDGAALSFSAATAEPAPDDPASFAMIGLTAEIATPDGGEVQISAGRADVDRSADMLTMTGGVVLDSSTGYHIEAEGLRAGMDRTWAESIGPVEARGPGGEISAGRVALERRGDAPGAYLLVFNEGVRMIYMPGLAENE